MTGMSDPQQEPGSATPDADREGRAGDIRAALLRTRLRGPVRAQRPLDRFLRRGCRPHRQGLEASIGAGCGLRDGVARRAAGSPRSGTPGASTSRSTPSRRCTKSVAIAAGCLLSSSRSDRVYDLVVCIEVVEHIDERRHPAAIGNRLVHLRDGVLRDVDAQASTPRRTSCSTSNPIAQPASSTDRGFKSLTMRSATPPKKSVQWSLRSYGTPQSCS